MDYNMLKRIISPLISPFYSGRGIILMFHRILSDTDRPRVHNTVLELKPSVLEEIISFFRYKDYAFLSMTELPHFLRKKGRRKFVIFTFDDGYVDNYTLAFPIFQKYRVPFTVYVTTDWIERREALWHYLAEEKLLGISELNTKIAGVELSMKIPDSPSKELAFNALRKIFLSLKPSVLRTELEVFMGKPYPELIAMTSDHVMTWFQLNDMASSELVEIGAHTVSHPALNVLSSSEALDEVLNSKSILEKKLNQPVVHFAYPYGSPGEIGIKEVEMLAGTDFQTGVTSRPGNIHNNHLSHLHALPRVFIDSGITLKRMDEYTSGKYYVKRNARDRIVVMR